MIKWCSNCQSFLGEVPAYDDFNITHGICASCEPKAATFSDADFEHALSLKRIQARLFVAGRHNDIVAAEKIIEDAAAVGCKPVDVLMGIIAPLLYQVGEYWKQGIFAVEDEHRFTAFCEQTLGLIAAKAERDRPARRSAGCKTDVLLVNAPDNRHTLAIHILALWLASHGVRARIADETPDPEELLAIIDRVKPNALLVSMALAEQSRGVIAMAGRIATLPSPVRPKIIVGGYAVKLGLVSHLPGADLMADISALSGKL